jgi:hypothetical protein
MSYINIDIANRSTVLKDTDIEPVVEAVQIQVTRDFAPIWGNDATLNFVGLNGRLNPDHWWLVVMDNSDDAGVGGYHDVSVSGQPMGKVFAASDIKYGASWTVTVSHEIVEMLADPAVDQTVFVSRRSSPGILFARESADACEADEFGYQIQVGSQQVLVSDFQTPAWFQSFRKPGSCKFDFMGHIQQPFQLLKGGYIGFMDLSGKMGWQQMYPTGARLEYRQLAHLGSRRERRGREKDHWMESTGN